VTDSSDSSDSSDAAVDAEPESAVGDAATDDVDLDTVDTADTAAIENAELGASTELDLDAVARDLDGVQAALERLAEGTYWTDEVTGEPIAPDVLDADPLVRRN
jgi:RNA polymerase-binding transcription factor DksA